MSNENQIYDNNSITVMEAVEANRRSPEILLGSKGVKGARHSVLEITANSSDEVESGFGDLIEIEYDSVKNIVTVKDNGRGIPLGWNETSQSYNWYNIFCIQHAGGKYKDRDDELNQRLISMSTEEWEEFDPSTIPYLYSVGTYGIGASATQQTSDFLTVISYRDGEKTTMQFRNGYPVVSDEHKEDPKLQPPLVEPYEGSTGTSVSWRPSADVFYEARIGEPFLRNVAEDLSTVTGVKTVLRVKGSDGQFKEEVFEVKPLLEVHSKKLDNSPYLLAKPRVVDYFDHGRFMSGAGKNRKEMVWVSEGTISYGAVSDGNGEIRAYHNGTRMHDGQHFYAVENILPRFFKEVVGIKVKKHEIEGILDVTMHTKSNYIDYNGADKNSIQSGWLGNLVETSIFDDMVEQYAYKTDTVMAIVNLVKKRVEERVNQEKFVSEIKEVKKETSKKKSIHKLDTFTPSVNYLTGKFLSKKDKLYANRICSPDEPSYNEVFIVEGNSAGGAAAQGRNRDFQSVWTPFGKPTNPFKSGDLKAISSEFMKGMLQIQDAGITIPSLPEESNYDASKEKVDKWIMLTDADYDGYHIRILDLANFILYNPEVVRRGRLFIAIPPLFKIKYTDGTKDFAINKTEREQAIASATSKGKKVSQVMYLKGIGEMETDDLAYSCMNPETRRLVQVQIDPYNPEFLSAMFDLLESSTTVRKQIFGHILGFNAIESEKEARRVDREVSKWSGFDDDNEEEFIFI